MKPSKPIELYWFRLSGHAHRAELMLSLLDLPFRRVEVDLRKGEQKTQQFLAMNAFGQVPVIDDGGVIVADSNAILVYLALRYDDARSWLPTDPATAAKIQRWLSVAAGPLAAGPAGARRVTLFDSKEDQAKAQSIARDLFAIMDAHLAGSGGFLVGGRATIADIALYSYTAHAPEGYIPLEPYPQICAWLSRIESLPGFVPMARTEPRFGEARSRSD